MPPRRGAPSLNTLSPQDSAASPSSPALLGLPRSASPSSGFTQFFSRPSKWFSRSASAPRIPSNNSEPRSSTGSTGRKHKISRPTDPRPIMDTYKIGASKSVVDLSTRPPGSLDIPPFPSPGLSSSPTTSSSGLGDLRNISRRGWSKSADDLIKMTPSNLSPITTSFQERIAQYRNRSDSTTSGISPSSPASPASFAGGRQPFPTSASPPRSATLPVPGMSASISAPMEETSRSVGQHVHTRSHSFTPKLSSKLAAPRLGPPSPIRKGSASSEREIPYRDTDKGTIGSSKSLPSVEPSSLPNQAGRPPTTLLAPPVIIEPGQELDPDSKRASQIVYHSGFINRLTDVSSNLFTYPHAATSASLEKGWKPFKMELKGSKLYLYKPPGDRSTAIKELFPSELVPVDQEGEEVEEPKSDDGGTPRARRDGDGTLGRKKRAYWGRRTHPELVLDGSQKVEKGSFEALIHETAFATTFADAEPRTAEESEGQTGWRDFAVTVLLWLPSLAGQSKFEAEFTRCCDFFVTGAQDDDRPQARQRVCWLADEYLRCHGAPGDESAWEEWRAETIPDWTPSAIAVSAGLPTSLSTQAIYAPSPLLGQLSPDLGTFSPRPGQDRKMVSLVDVLSLPPPENSPPSPSRSPVQRSADPQGGRNLLHPTVGGKLPWAVLEAEGLTRPVFLTLDPHLLARSLTLFHRMIVEQTPDHFTPDLVMSASNVPSHLFGSEDHPHWLTKLVLLQILSPDSAGGSATPAYLASPGRHSEDRPVNTSRTHSRSEAISTWARIGELCRSAGDECSWRAVAAALCSRPVARLEKAWKRVDPQALAAIESWVYPPQDGESLTVKEPRVTPWGGDQASRVSLELQKARAEDTSEYWVVEPLDQARTVFESLRTTFALCPRRAVVPEDELSDDIRRMVAFWRDVAASGGGSGGIASKFQRIDQFMSLSLAAEPRRKGLFEPYFWTRSLAGHAPYASLIPLTFPDPLPSLTLVDRQQILRGRQDSDPADIRFLPLDERKAGRDIAGIKHSGTVIPVFDGELILVVRATTDRPVSLGGSRPPSSRAPSRPPSSVMDAPTGEKGVSRTPSIRVKPGSSQNLERKTSMARRNSLPAISQRQDITVSEPSSEPPLRVLVQAGMLNILVQILVHGLKKVSVSVADDNGEMSLKEGKTRQLFVDQEEFSNLWWNVFRSFVTPLVFFELLRKLYIGFKPSEQSVDAYANTIRKRTEVLYTIKEWLSIGGGSQDILDDSQLFTAIRAFFDSPAEHVIPDLPADIAGNANLVQAITALKAERESLAQTLALQTMRPHASKGLKPISTPVIHMSRTRAATSREPPDIDRVSPEELVDNLNAMACAAFSNVSEEDLHITADILEVQTADRTGWLPQRELPTSDEMAEIQTLYTILHEVEPSSLISEMAQDAVYRLLPPGIRSCIRAYGILRKWLIHKIVAPRLGVQARQRRIELLLQAIETARRRSFCPSSSSHLPVAEQPCIRSFVEAVVSSALLSPESRLHHRAWQAVAQARGSNCDSLASLLARPSVSPPNSTDTLTVDMGWLLERMLEIIASPDVLDNPGQPGQTVINLDKRRYLCSLISDAVPVATPRKRAQLEEVIRRGFDRLNHIEREVNALQFDQRGIKEEAHRENMQTAHPNSASARKPLRPFHKMVVAQLDKNRRDKNLRARLQKEKLQEQNRNEKRDDMLNKAMRPRKPTPLAQKQQRNKKSMSAFLQFMRPISSAFGADVQPTLLKRSPSELDFVPSGKPSLVLSVVDARVAQYINTVRSFTFQLDTEDGGHYLLQAMNRPDMNRWIETINRVTKMTAKRRLTYLGNSPKPQVADHIHDQPRVPSRDPLAVFAVDLQFLIRREAGGEALPGAIPSVIEHCLGEIESRGLREVGIYRIAGANSEINALKEAFNRSENPIQPDTDIHAVCDLVKTWFRLLPEPVFPASFYFEIIDAAKTEELDTRLSRIRDVIQRLPQGNFDLLRRVAEHLDKVTDFEEHNQMTAEALAIVFSPNLLRNPLNDFGMILANMPHTHKLVKALITHFHVLFDEADPEGDIDHEEYDSPIPEEDEEEGEEEEEVEGANESPEPYTDDTQRSTH
ncbi:hypothetical protein HGRIS_001768 [Hohenbuehelia grisea]|uniref:Uncharacterized protein n=1 Tax=Hohenbuehelia grisea TaxID=104357 RepID=A0ABR3JJ87_9AGAR